MDDLEERKPGIMDALKDWLTNYKVQNSMLAFFTIKSLLPMPLTVRIGSNQILKTSEGGEKNVIKSNTHSSKDNAVNVINDCNTRWKEMQNGDRNDQNYCLGTSSKDDCDYSDPFE